MGGSMFWKWLALVLLVLLVASHIYSGSLPTFGGADVEQDAAVEKAVAFINERLLAGLASAEVSSVSESGGLYVVEFTVESSDGVAQDFTSYVTLDGELLFPSAVDLTEFVYEPEEETAVEETEVDGALDTDGDPVLGNSDSAIEIVVWSDYSCETCNEAYWALALTLEEYAEDVHAVFKHFPSSEEGVGAAIAAECAHRQDAFAAYYDTLFQNAEALDFDSLKQYAADLGLDTEAFDGCLDTAVTAEDEASEPA